MADEKEKYEYKKFEYDVPWDATGKYTTFTPSGATNAALGKQSDAEKAYTDFVGAGYTYANQQMLNDYMSKYQGRDPFSYDFNTDAMYQQYKDKYMKQGKMAMQDTMGQAAAMTGGYGSSYASTAGNQAYQASLENLNDIIPQLYQMAYDRYNQEGQDMLNNISLLQSERGFDYGVWGDKANMLAGDRGYYQTEANNQWNKDYGVWNDNRTFDRGVWESDRTLAHGEHTNAEGIRYDEYRNAIADEQWRKEFEYKNSLNSGSDDTPGGNDPQPQPQPQPDPEPQGFTGKTYKSAVEYMEQNGVPSSYAVGVMTASEWTRRKSSYNRTGQGDVEVKNYDTYQEYLNDFVTYALENYGKK